MKRATFKQLIPVLIIAALSVAPFACLVKPGDKDGTSGGRDLTVVENPQPKEKKFFTLPPIVSAKLRDLYMCITGISLMYEGPNGDPEFLRFQFTGFEYNLSQNDINFGEEELRIGRILGADMALSPTCGGNAMDLGLSNNQDYPFEGMLMLRFEGPVDVTATTVRLDFDMSRTMEGIDLTLVEEPEADPIHQLIMAFQRHPGHLRVR
jgi:hypothetical protein